MKWSSASLCWEWGGSASKSVVCVSAKSPQRIKTTPHQYNRARPIWHLWAERHIERVSHSVVLLRPPLWCWQSMISAFPSLSSSQAKGELIEFGRKCIPYSGPKMKETPSTDSFCTSHRTLILDLQPSSYSFSWHIYFGKPGATKKWEAGSPTSTIMPSHPGPTSWQMR